MRDVSCVQVYRDGVEPILTPGKCNDKTKPASRHECNKHPCHNYWHVGEWSKVLYETIYELDHIFLI